MARRRRYLICELAVDVSDEAFAACPEAARTTDEEAEEFCAAARYLDWVECQEIVRSFRRARIAYPTELTFDEYRLGRYLFRRWRDPAVREAFLERGMELDLYRLTRLARSRDLVGFRPTMAAWGSPAAIYFLRRLGMADLVQPLRDSFTPEEEEEYQGLLRLAKLLMHRYLNEPEPARAPSPWEQRKLARRVRLREVQLRSMRRSLRTLRQERKGLLARLRDLGRIDSRELDGLADELLQIRSQRAAAESNHAAALAAQAARYREELARLRAELTAAEREYSTTLAIRRTWLPGSRG